MLDAVEDFDNDDNRSISNFSMISTEARKVLKDLEINKPEGNNTFKVLEKTTTSNFNLRKTGMYFRVIKKKIHFLFIWKNSNMFIISKVGII